jgi:hypothetical protein
MAKKSFLLGLGLGLLLATLTLQLDFWKVQTDQQINAGEMTVEKLREEAKKFDYELKTKNEIQLEIEKAIEQYKNKQNSGQPQSNSQSKPTQQTSGNAANVTTTLNGTKKTPTSIKITIQKGWDATQVANYLHESNVVKDKNALLKALVGISKTRQIAARSFYLEPNSDPKQVAQTITTGK